MTSGVTSWSTTANSNATADSTINWAEGMAPSAVNDSARAMMARIADWRDSLNGTNVTAGTSTAYTLTSDQSFAALAAGLEVAFQVDQDCGATVTLNVDSLGAKPLRRAAGVELVAGALRAGAVYRATYFTSNSGEWLLHDCTPTIIAADQVVTASILNKAVTLAKLDDLATQKLIGRNAGSTGVPEAVSILQALNWLVTTRGDIITRGASDPQRLALGASGAVLTSDGTDAVWALPKLVKLSTQTASTSSALNFTSGIDSTYKKYVFDLHNVLPATNDMQLLMEVSDDGGSSWKQTSYLTTSWFTDNAAASYGGVPTTAIGVSLGPSSNNGVANNSGYGLSGTVELLDPSNTSSRKNILLKQVVYRRGGGGIISGNGGGYWDGGNAALTAVRFRYSTSDITSGAIIMYGVV